MDVTYPLEVSGIGKFLTDVILNGGEAAVRDRTMVGGFDVVDGNAYDACSV